MKQNSGKRVVSKLIVIGCCAGLSLRCSDDSNAIFGSELDGGSSRGSSTVQTYQQYVAELIHALCDYMVNCPLPNDDQLGARVKLQTIARCENYYTEMYQRSSSQVDLERSVENGTVLFDADNANALLATRHQCERANITAMQLYGGVLRGTIAEGESCYRNETCAGNGYCAFPDQSCPGVCTARKPVGSECESSYECDDSTGFAECDWSADTGLCVIRQLSNKAREDEPCGLLAKGNREFCVGGLWCDGPYNEQGICRPPIAIGDPCFDVDHPCEGLAFCKADDINDTCQNVEITYEPGGPCDEGTGIRPRMCDPLAGLTCISGVCEVVGNGTVGSPCLPGDEEELSCERGLYCSTETDPPSCQALRPGGAACTDSSACMFSCDYGTRTCTDRYCSAG